MPNLSHVKPNLVRSARKHDVAAFNPQLSPYCACSMCHWACAQVQNCPVTRVKQVKIFREMVQGPGGIMAL